MGVALYTAAGAMNLELRRQQVIARNLASSNLPGYKREYVTSHAFDKKLHDSISENTADYLGTSAGKIKIDYSQGCMNKTDRPLDFVIKGIGFFTINTPEGKPLYTRNGEFHLNKDRVLTTSEGFEVASRSGGRIQFNVDDNLSNMEVTTDGYIRMRDPDQGTTRDVGILKIVSIPNEEDIIRLTANYFTTRDGTRVIEPEPFTGEKYGDPFTYEVYNAYQETSNSSPIRDMTALIESSRYFEMSKQTMTMIQERGRKVDQTFTG